MNKNKPKRSIKKPNSKKAVWLFAVILMVLVAAWFIYRSIQNQNNGTELSNQQNEKAQFVSGKECVNCHLKEYDLWKHSKHDDAMDVANDSTVLGDFNNTEVLLKNKKHRFYKRDGRFFVYTQGAGGKFDEYEVTHTFGIRPLQQYLVPVGRGKYQCLPIAWDVNKKRWFDMAAMVYSKEELKPESWLYWTNQSQNWNGMCAECHSTNLQKNYFSDADSFNTTWSDIDVNCEACHGPGSKHLEWAKLSESERESAGNKGLVLKTGGTTPKQFIESCAPCHSRRTSLGPNTHTDSNYYNNHIPQNIIPPLYHADGQILEEDYEFASFNQSKMHMQGVKCSNCHDPHSLKFKEEGNALCTQCHQKEKYDAEKHHFHKYNNEKGELVKNKFGETVAVGEGTLCVNCHMPGKYYMGIDFRRDHGIRVPRPDISEKYKTPNACITCHSDKSNKWAADFVIKNYGETRKYSFETALLEGSLQRQGADTALINIIRSDLFPEFVRAAALSYLSAYNNPYAPEAIRQMLNSPEPFLRDIAIDVYETSDIYSSVSLLLPLLKDPVKIVRIAAASKLSGIAKENFTSEQFAVLTSVLDEYLVTILYTADFPAGKYNLGNFYNNKGDYAGAIKFYNKAIASDSLFYPAKSNLALLYYKMGEQGKAEMLFKNLIRKHSEYTEGYYYLGLLYAEQKKFKEAAEILEEGSIKDPLNNRLFYNLGIIYHQHLQNMTKAEATLLRAYSLSPNDFDIMYALSDFYIKKKNLAAAMRYANEIRNKHPNNQNGIKLLNYLNQLMK